MKTLGKWLIVLCAIGWAGHNPGQVSTDIHSLMGVGEQLVSAVGNAVGSAASGVGSGTAPAAPASPAPAPAAPGH
jgi:hypothetical protein